MTALKLIPFLKQTIWGGQRLKALYGGADMENIAESWVLSCHRAGPCVVAGGEFDGRTLADVLAVCGDGVLGTKKRSGEFPILIKLIDAADKLSVQVHPDDAYARRNENDNGKTECWYILDADENAELIFGVKEAMTREEFRAHIEADTLTEAVRRVRVKKGDVAFIPAGTLHAIGGGILLAEVQQSSDVTYRVYDYGRLQNGKPRELHIDKAVETTTLTPSDGSLRPLGAPIGKDGYTETLLASCAYFTMTRLEIESSLHGQKSEESFISLLATDGAGEYRDADGVIPLKKGDSLFIPAGTGSYTVEGRLDLLKTTL